LNLSITFGYDHYWKGGDPYGTLTQEALLIAFKNYWNANYPQPSWSRNVAHLFSDNYISTSVGVGYVGEICKDPSFAYSATYYPNTGGSEAYSTIMAHEIGHNLGGEHTSRADTGYQEPGCENTLMQQIIQIGFNTFCPFSITQITNYDRPLYDPNEPEGLLCNPTLQSPLP
jgi:hypothetical protein